MSPLDSLKELVGRESFNRIWRHRSPKSYWSVLRGRGHSRTGHLPGSFHGETSSLIVLNCVGRNLCTEDLIGLMVSPGFETRLNGSWCPSASSFPSVISFRLTAIAPRIWRPEKLRFWFPAPVFFLVSFFGV